MKRLGINDSNILEVMGWKDVTMLRSYIAAIAMEDCCCILCMDEHVATDGHRMSRSGNAWVGWRGLAMWGALFAVEAVVLWLVEATG